MGNLAKELAKCKHPNSRKTKALAKKAKRMNDKHKSQLGHALKSNVVGEKLTWFLQHMDDRQTQLNPSEFKQLIQKYLQRFDDELEQIKLKQSISKNRAHQHAARLNVIKFTTEREKDEFNGGGMELPNLCDMQKVKWLQQWDGNAINVQHIKLDLISRKFLSSLEKESQMEAVSESCNVLNVDGEVETVVMKEEKGHEAIEEKKTMICDDT